MCKIPHKIIRLRRRGFRSSINDAIQEYRAGLEVAAMRMPLRVDDEQYSFAST